MPKTRTTQIDEKAEKTMYSGHFVATIAKPAITRSAAFEAKSNRLLTVSILHCQSAPCDPRRNRLDWIKWSNQKNAQKPPKKTKIMNFSTAANRSALGNIVSTTSPSELACFALAVDFIHRINAPTQLKKYIEMKFPEKKVTISAMLDTHLPNLQHSFAHLSELFDD